MNRASATYRTLVTVEHQVFGVAFLALLLGACWLTYAIYNKSFTDYEPVYLRADKTGLQLPERADVKIRGVVVGEVVRREPAGDGVRLTLGLYPEQLAIIPANVSARILPKTLFGEKFVALQVPEDPVGESISAGDVITESRVAIEVQRVLSDVYPLLRTVQPAEINYTLNAMATALEGRGEAIGESLSVLDGYLRRMNPEIPVLVENLRKLGAVSEVYREVVPELANILRNSVTTGQTFVAKEQKIKALFGDVARFSDVGREFLAANGDNMVRLAEQGQAQLPLFEEYSPIFPCLLDGIVGAIPRQAQAFRDYTLHINLEVLPRQPRGYGVQDDPQYADHRGVTAQNIEDCRDSISGRWNQRDLPPDRVVPELHTGVEYPLGKRAATGFDVTSGFAGTTRERSFVNRVVSPVMGVDPDQVPDVATLLFGPLARGTEVSVR
jgi:phospholipid/cholesterol/gamma-HCH transport system substrate-binding protein